MGTVERILGKIVGQELSKEEMDLVSGGVPECVKTMWMSTWQEVPTCDENQDYS